jgi:hypothetical protein
MPTRAAASSLKVQQAEYAECLVFGGFKTWRNRTSGHSFHARPTFEWAITPIFGARDRSHTALPNPNAVQTSGPSRASKFIP